MRYILGSQDRKTIPIPAPSPLPCLLPLPLFYISPSLLSFLSVSIVLVPNKKIKEPPSRITFFPHNRKPSLHQLKQPFHRTLHAMSQKYDQIFSLWFGSHLNTPSFKLLLRDHEARAKTSSGLAQQLSQSRT